MAHITHIKVDGLAGSKKTFSVSLDRAVNVFYGVNGCGKTTLLRLIDSAMTGDSSLVEGAPFDRAEVSIHSLQDKKTYLATLDRKSIIPQGQQRGREVVLRSGKKVRVGVAEPAPWHFEPRQADSDGRVSFQHEFLSIHRLYLGHLTRMHEALSEEDPTSIERPYEQNLQHYWLRYYARIQHDIQGIQRRGIGDIVASLIVPKAGGESQKAVDPAQAYERLRRFFVTQGSPSTQSQFQFITRDDFKVSLQGHSNLQGVVAAVDKIESDISVATAPKTKLQSFVNELIYGPKQVAFGEDDVSVLMGDGSKISTANLSSGEKHILLLLVASLRAGPSSLLIDEPEMSLHLKWQHRLLEMMRELNGEAQIIAATHSPEMMIGLSDAQIHRVDG